jgi:hypothetical protein
MHLQLNTDRHLRGSEDLERRIQADVDTALERFAQRGTRIE